MEKIDKTGLLKQAKTLAMGFIKFTNESPSPFHVVGKKNVLISSGFGKNLILEFSNFSLLILLFLSQNDCDYPTKMSY